MRKRFRRERGRIEESSKTTLYRRSSIRYGTGCPIAKHFADFLTF